MLLISCSVVSESLWPHGLQHARLPCPSLSPRACSNSCPSSRWCHPTISSFVTPLSSCLQSFPASGSCPMSPLFTSSGQSIGASALASVLSMNIQDWFPLGLTNWISMLSKGLSRVFSSTTVWKHQFFITQPSLGSNSDIHIWLLETTQLWTFVSEVIMLYRFAITFLPKSKSLNFMAAVTVCSDFGTQENEVCHFTLKRKQKGHTKIQMLGSELGLLTSSDHH